MRYLDSIRNKPLAEGKVVLAVNDEFCILALGSSDVLHNSILTRAAEEILPGRAISRWDKSSSKPAPCPGVSIGGAYFRIQSWEKRIVEITGSSSHFGELPEGFFDEPVEEVVRKTICSFL